MVQRLYPVSLHPLESMMSTENATPSTIVAECPNVFDAES